VEIFNQINIKARNTCQEADVQLKCQSNNAATIALSWIFNSFYFEYRSPIRSGYETTLSIRFNPKWIFLFRNPIGFGSDLHISNACSPSKNTGKIAITVYIKCCQKYRRMTWMTLLLRPVKTIVCCRYNLSINKDELKYVLVPIFVNVAGRFWPSFLQYYICFPNFYYFL
jgi:hypothetical protein